MPEQRRPILLGVTHGISAGPHVLVNETKRVREAIRRMPRDTPIGIEASKKLAEGIFEADRSDVLMAAIRIARKHGNPIVPLDIRGHHNRIFKGDCLSEAFLDRLNVIFHGDIPEVVDLGQLGEEMQSVSDKIDLEMAARSHAMGKRIVRHRPNLVIIGNLHARDLHEALKDDYDFEFSPHDPRDYSLNLHRNKLVEKITRQLSSLRAMKGK